MIVVNGKKVQFESFPNGETRIVTDSLPECGWHISNIIFKYENDSDLIKLMMVKNYFNQIKVKAEKLTITYMPYSRMDRSENDSPFTLKYVTNLINSLGFQDIKVVEPHSDVTCALLDNVRPYYINFDLIEFVKTEVKFNEKEDYIMFPDAGASKRYSKMRANNVLIGNKVRDFATGDILGLDLIGDKKGQGNKAIIVDDLSSYGGTFKHSASRLKAEGFEEIYLLVAHAENSIFVPKGEEGKEDTIFDYVNKVFTTDSIITAQNDWNNKKFESQLQIYPLFGGINL